MVKFDDRTALFVELEGASLFVDAVDATHINEDINELRADLVMLHLHWVIICRDVDLAYHVK